jgi:hypothetical protein
MDAKFSLGTLPDGQLVLICDNAMIPSVIRDVEYYIESKLVLLNFLDGQEEESFLIPFELNEEASCLVNQLKIVQLWWLLIPVQTARKLLSFRSSSLDAPEKIELQEHTIGSKVQNFFGVGQP